MAKERLIMDVDPGIDDSLAILLALKSPEIIVEGITVVSGNVELHQATKNAMKAVDMSGAWETKVYKGMALPLVKEYIDATDTHGTDGIGENYFPVPSRTHEEEHAVDFILNTVRNNPGEVTLLALGPLTNIAAAIEKDVETMRKVKKLVLMGGTARHQGNCSAVAEYNFWVDPHAAEILFSSGIEVTMVGLDVTHKIVLTPNLRELINQFNNELSRYIFNITQFYVDFHWQQERTLGCVINDPLAVAILVNPSLAQTRDAHVDIVTEGKAEGQSLVDFGGVWTDGKTNAKVCMDVDARKFFELFLGRLFPEHADDIELVLEKQCFK
ncbi:MAG TPA: nucleoside hydrolase [Bacillota bacterium]|nr:nucleoside hydrolase [Bacillota bacterium]